MEVETLMGVYAGRWRIRTEHSSYVLDLDARTITRDPQHADASELSNDGATIPLVALVRCEIGRGMNAIIQHPDRDCQTTRATTPVVKIERMGEDA